MKAQSQKPQKRAWKPNQVTTMKYTTSFFFSFQNFLHYVPSSSLLETEFPRTCWDLYHKKKKYKLDKFRGSENADYSDEVFIYWKNFKWWIWEVEEEGSGERGWHWHCTRLKFEENPEEDVTWIQREFIQVWILMALRLMKKKNFFILNYV